MYISMLNNNLMNNISRHTNVSIPKSDNISFFSFPKQNKNLINTNIILKYRDYNEINKFDESNLDIHRPEDDDEYIKKDSESPDDIEYVHVKEDTFKVLRADIEDPYKLIAISENYSVLLVGSSEQNSDGSYEYENIILKYPQQKLKYVGSRCTDLYDDGNLFSDILRIDDGEPTEIVFREESLNGDIRYILGEEILSQLYLEYEGDHSVKENIPFIRKLLMGEV